MRSMVEREIPRYARNDQSGTTLAIFMPMTEEDDGL